MVGKEGAALTPAMRVTICVIVVLVIAGAAVIAALNGIDAAPDAVRAPASPSAAQDAPTTGPRPGGTPAAGSEVPPPSATPGAGLPPRESTAPLVRAPLPASGSRSGGLVKGFPVDAAGPTKGASVQFTSIATQDTVMQVDLIAVTTDGAEEIRAHYRRLWASLGLQPLSTSDGTVAYSGQHESLTLAIGSSGTGNRYTIHGVFRTE